MVVLVQAAKSLTCSQNYLFFWGQNVDEAGENSIKAFIQEVFQVLSSYLPQGLNFNVNIPSWIFDILQ